MATTTGGLPPERAREQELHQQVKTLQQEPGLQALKLLLVLRLKRLDRELRRCPCTDVARVQGQAQLIEKMLDDFWSREE